MTEVLHPSPSTSPAATPDAVGDAELIALVRAGDSAAYEELFLRHRDVAIRYARRISDSERAEDLCAEAFTKILDLLQRGKGPDVAFRAYLLTTVRTSHLNNLRSSNREELVPDHEPMSRMLPVIEDPDHRFDQHAIVRAFAQLPERWQTVLWLTAVEGRSHDEVSEQLEIKSNAVASLAFRARAGLRQAYLAEHLLTTNDPQCRAVIEQLPSYLGERMTSRRRRHIDEHLGACKTCTAAALELTEVDSKLGALLAPLVLAGFTASSIATAQTTGLVALAKAPIGALLGNVKAVGSALPATLGTKAAAAAAVTVLGVAVGTEILHQQPAPSAPSGPVIQGKAPAPQIVTRPARPLTPMAVTTPAPSPATTPAAPAEIRPVVASVEQPPSRQPSTPPSPVVTPHQPATPTPEPTAPPSEPANTQRSMALAQPTDETYYRSGSRWERVWLRVTDAPKGASLVITTDRTIQVAQPVTAGTGWVCGVPTTNWANGGPYASTKIVCSYDANGTEGPIQIDYNVLSNANWRAEVKAPYGYSDDSLLDNVVTYTLRR